MKRISFLLVLTLSIICSIIPHAISQELDLNFTEQKAMESIAQKGVKWGEYKVIFPFKPPTNKVEKYLLERFGVVNYMKYMRSKNGFNWAVSIGKLSHGDLSKSKDLWDSMVEGIELAPYVEQTDVLPYQASRPGYQGTNVHAEPLYYQQSPTGRLISIENPDIEFDFKEMMKIKSENFAANSANENVHGRSGPYAINNGNHNSGPFAINQGTTNESSKASPYAINSDTVKMYDEFGANETNEGSEWAELITTKIHPSVTHAINVENAKKTARKKERADAARRDAARREEDAAVAKNKKIVANKSPSKETDSVVTLFPLIRNKDGTIDALGSEPFGNWKTDDLAPDLSNLYFTSKYQGEPLLSYEDVASDKSSFQFSLDQTVNNSADLDTLLKIYGH